MQLDLFPLHTVLFPEMRLPLHIFEPRYLKMIGECVKSDCVFGVVLIADGEEVGEAATPCATGTTARVTRIDQQPGGQLDLVVVGESRFQIDSIISSEPRVVPEVEFAPLLDDDSEETRVAAEDVRARFDRLVTLMIEVQSGYMPSIDLPENVFQLAYLVAAGVPSDLQMAQQLLEAPTLRALFEMERELLDVRVEQALRRLQSKQDSRRN
jgi:Lon protease-like protein